MTGLDTALERARRGFAAFVSRCQRGANAYAITPHADESLYARCFAVFCHHLAYMSGVADERIALATAIRDGVRQCRKMDIDPAAKPFRQLLAFSLSALSVLDALPDDPLDDLVEEQLPRDVKSELDGYGCLAGRPGSGNHAMFSAVFMLHARDYLGRDTQDRIENWVNLHLDHMNRFGFWGPARSMTHLQFQNGYHQYEILEYLGVATDRKHESVAAVRSLADRAGHFAPYPGGGGCYDYDAVFILTPGGNIPDAPTRSVLERTAASILAEQQPDGGFAESLCVRPRGAANTMRMVRHVADGRLGMPLLVERLRYGLSLQRSKHNRIHTHWSRYSRRWDESDLWDSWFRMMALARIQSAFDPQKAATWGFIDYPGIGYHASLKSNRRVSE